MKSFCIPQRPQHCWSKHYAELLSHMDLIMVLFIKGFSVDQWSSIIARNPNVRGSISREKLYWLTFVTTQVTSFIIIELTLTSCRHSGQVMIWLRPFFFTSFTRHPLQSVCKHGRTFGSLNCSKQTAQHSCLLISSGWAQAMSSLKNSIQTEYLIYFQVDWTYATKTYLKELSLTSD